MNFDPETQFILFFAIPMGLSLTVAFVVVLYELVRDLKEWFHDSSNNKP